MASGTSESSRSSVDPRDRHDSSSDDSSSDDSSDDSSDNSSSSDDSDDDTSKISEKRKRHLIDKRKKKLHNFFVELDTQHMITAADMSSRSLYCGN